MAEQVSSKKLLGKSQLLGLAQEMASNACGAVSATAQLKAIEFLLEHGDQGEGSVEDVWDELFLVGEEV